MYAASDQYISIELKLSSLVQYTADLSTNRCQECLSFTVGTIQGCTAAGKAEGRILTPSCIASYKYHFYGSPLPPPPTNSSNGSPPPLSDNGLSYHLLSEGRKRKLITITISISLSVFLVVTLLACIYYQKRRKRTNVQRDDGNRSEDELHNLAGERFGNDYNSENLQVPPEIARLSLNSIRYYSYSKQNVFLKKNELGEGGFGPVYKKTIIRVTK